MFVSKEVKHLIQSHINLTNILNDLHTVTELQIAFNETNSFFNSLKPQPQQIVVY